MGAEGAQTPEGGRAQESFNASSTSREAALEAALDLFAKQGYERTTISQIAKRAGVSRGSISWHFRSKDEVLQSVMERSFARWQALVDEIADLDGPEMLARALSVHKDLIDEDPRFIRLYWVLLAEALQSPDKKLLARYLEFHQHVLSMAPRLLETTEGGAFEHLDPDAFGHIVIAVLAGLSYQSLISEDFDSNLVYSNLAFLFGRGFAS